MSIAMKEATKKYVLNKVENSLSATQKDAQAYDRAVVAVDSIANHLSLSIVEEVDDHWLIAVVAALAMMRPEAHLPYLKRVLDLSLPQVTQDLNEMMVVAMHTQLNGGNLH